LNTSASYYIDLHVPTTGRDLTAFTLDYRSSETNGPETLDIYYSTNGTDFTSLGSASLVRDTAFHTLSSFDISASVLDNSANLTFRLYAYGPTTTSAGTLELDNIIFTGNCVFSPLSVLINEVAWAGTGISGSSYPNDEWIELYNPGSDISLDGWRLTDNLPSSTDIDVARWHNPSKGYFLLGDPLIFLVIHQI
jgi:hypothetical protein